MSSVGESESERRGNHVRVQRGALLPVREFKFYIRSLIMRMSLSPTGAACPEHLDSRLHLLLKSNDNITMNSRHCFS